MMAKKVDEFAEVAPLIPLPATSSQTYTYKVPHESCGRIRLYQRVTIPFGKRKVEGVVIKLHTFRVPYPTKMLSLAGQSVLTPEQVAFGQWISKTMHGGLGFSLRLFFSRSKAIEPAKEAGGKAQRLPSNGPAKKLLKQLLEKPGALIDDDNDRRWQSLAELAQSVAAKGEQTLIVVPEKWLAQNLAEIFYKYFPKEHVVIVSSDTTIRNEKLNWQRAAAGDISVVIGTQKAFFMPYSKLGLVVLEQEIFHTHKLWDAYPRLHNRLAARELAAIHKSPLVYSSGLPSLALTKEIAEGSFVVMRNSPTKMSTKVIKLAFEDRKKHFLIPNELIDQIKRWSAKKERVFILHNRRGFWTTVMCRSCRTVLRCPTCNLALSQSDNALFCRHCGTEQALPSACPACRKKTLMPFGAGAEKIASILHQHLKRHIVTIDTENISDKGEAAVKKIFTGNQFPVVIGTSAALRFMDDRSVDHVIFMMPERSLLYPDFRSSERAYYLCWRLQRLAKGKAPVILATAHPRLIDEELSQTREKIYDRQMTERRRLAYPPFRDIVQLTFQSNSTAGALKKALIIRGKIKKSLPSDTAIRGPYQKPGKVRGKYEAHLLLTGKLTQLAELYSRLPIDVVDVWPEKIS